MVKYYDKGVYLLDGKTIVDAADAKGLAAPDEAREGTIAYSIMRAHDKSADPKKMRIKFDALMSHDITFVGIIQTARASGMKHATLVPMETAEGTSSAFYISRY